MPRFSEVVLLLVSFMLLPSLFVNGLQELRPTVNYNLKLTRRNAVIRGLLFSRQLECDPGFNVCETISCCPLAWNCCSSSSFPSTLPSFSPSLILNFLRWRLLWAWVSVSNWLQVWMVWSIVCEYSTVCAVASNGVIGCCFDGEVCTGPVVGP